MIRLVWISDPASWILNHDRFNPVMAGQAKLNKLNKLNKPNEPNEPNEHNGHNEPNRLTGKRANGQTGPTDREEK